MHVASMFEIQEEQSWKIVIHSLPARKPDAPEAKISLAWNRMESYGLEKYRFLLDAT